MTFTKAYGVENTEGEVLNMLGTTYECSPVAGQAVHSR
jgi:hypothetical protein